MIVAPWPTTRILADRVRELIGAEAAVAVKEHEDLPVGGLAFLVGGHMAVAVSGRGGLMVRVDPSQAARLCARPQRQQRPR